MDARRRQTLTTIAAGIAAALPGAACAQDKYPSRQLTIVVPYPPGASTDATARMVAARMGEDFGQPVIVENRAGAGGAVGATYVAKSPGDGYRVLLATQPILTINPHLQKSTGFDPMAELVPVSGAINAVVAVCVHSSVPAKSLAELIAHAKANPGKVTFGSAGTGSPQHVGGIMLAQRAGIEMVHVPYKGGGPMVTDLLAGHINVGIATLSVFKKLIGDSRVRVIAVGEATRYSGTPDIATIAETLPGFELNTWLGFFGPAGMPAPIRAAVSGAIVKALGSAPVSGKLAELALLVQPGGPAALEKVVRADHETYGRIIRDYKITAS